LELEHYTIHARILADFKKYLSQDLSADRIEKEPSEYDTDAVENRAAHWLAQHFMEDDTNPVHSFFKRCAAATGLDNVEIIVCIQQPGATTPMHQDFFYSYRKRHNLDILDNDRYHRIKRYWMPLEDWKPGHSYRSNNKVYSYWEAGDMFTGPEDHNHSASTAGTEPRYFAQITGTIPENGEYLGKNGYQEITII